MSRVTCHVSHIFFFSFSDKIVKLVCGWSVVNGAPCLGLYTYINLWTKMNFGFLLPEIKIKHQLYVCHTHLKCKTCSKSGQSRHKQKSYVISHNKAQCKRCALFWSILAVRLELTHDLEYLFKCYKDIQYLIVFKIPLYVKKLRQCKVVNLKWVDFA